MKPARRPRLARLLVAVALATAPVAASTVAGCGPAATSMGGGIRRGAATDQAAYDAAVAAGNTAWDQRADRTQLEAAIARWEEAVKLKDDDVATYEKLARANYLLADGWLSFEPEHKQQLLDTYAKGYGYAERGLKAQNKDVEARLDAGVDLKDACALVDKEGIGLLYWYATNLGKWGNAQDITVVLTYKDRIYAIMQRVFDLDTQFFYGAADRYFGAYYAIAPSFAGGDLDKSWQHFQETMRIAPNYTATWNLIAEFYAPKRQDEKLFDDMTQKVLDAPGDIIPELAPETAVEKRKAEALRKRKADGEFPF
ncbi:MAG TPA: TRAP transporter TatT component family protein [Kofleriaceae bacterium]|nr:TRAP transporter TatT component family protein [Kofleriaceae bacterium]